MTALDWINTGMQTILPGAIGWLLVLMVMKDARHRAWAALTTLAVIVSLLLLPLWNGSNTDPQAERPSPWLPEWKVALAEPAPVLVFAEGPQSNIEAASWDWPHWSLALVWVWCGVSIVLALLHLWRTLTTMWWQKGLPHHERDGVSVRVAKGIDSPCLAGVLNPQIVVPEAALQTWSPQQWRWTLMHEQEHLRGGDALVSWCLGWTKAVLWWNPFVHRLIGEWEQAREEICDHAAAAQVEDAAPYSEFLLSVADMSRSPGVPMAVSWPARRLKARLLCLLEHRPVRRWPHWSFLVLVSGLSVLWISLAGCVSLQRTHYSVDEGPLMTRSFKVGSDFLSLLETTTEEGLKSYGVDFPPGANAVVNADTGQLIVKNTKRRLDQVESLIGALKSKDDIQNVQIYLSTKWIEMPSDMPVVQDLSVLTDNQFGVLLRSLGQQKGIDLMIAPSVTIRNGQRATIEVMQEMRTSAGKQDFSGVRSELVPMIHEHKIQLCVVADIGTAFRGGKRLWRRYDTDDKAVTIKHLIRRETAAVKDSETLVVHWGEPVKGRKVVLFLTPALISPSGQALQMREAMSLQAKNTAAPRVKSEASAKPTPTDQSVARVRLSAALFEIPGDFLPDHKTADSGPPNVSRAAAIPPSMLVVSGVLTPEQFRKTAAEWSADSKTQIGEAVTVAQTGSKVRMELGGGSEATIQPVLGAGGYTIDLNITPRLRSQGQTKEMTSSITIWDQQTVFLGGVLKAGPDGNPQRSQVLAITAQIVK